MWPPPNTFFILYYIKALNFHRFQYNKFYRFSMLVTRTNQFTAYIDRCNRNFNLIKLQRLTNPGTITSYMYEYNDDFKLSVWDCIFRRIQSNIVLFWKSKCYWLTIEPNIRFNYTFCYKVRNVKFPVIRRLIFFIFR